MVTRGAEAISHNARTTNRASRSLALVGGADGLRAVSSPDAIPRRLLPRSLKAHSRWHAAVHRVHTRACSGDDVPGKTSSVLPCLIGTRHDCGCTFALTAATTTTPPPLPPPVSQPVEQHRAPSTGLQSGPGRKRWARLGVEQVQGLAAAVAVFRLEQRRGPVAPTPPEGRGTPGTARLAELDAINFGPRTIRQPNVIFSPFPFLCVSLAGIAV